MSKTATVRALRASDDEPQIVRSVRALQETVQTLATTAAALRSSLNALPEATATQATSRLDEIARTLQQELAALPAAIAAETATGLEPIEGLRAEVRKVLAAYDQVAAVQRRTLDELAAETAQKAAAAMEERTQSLDRTLRGAERRQEALQSLLEALRSAESLPDRLDQAGRRLAGAAARAQPRPLRQLAAMILAGSLGGGLVLGGIIASERLLPQPAAPAPLVTRAELARLQNNDTWTTRLLRNALPAERTYIEKIYDRETKPAKQPAR